MSTEIFSNEVLQTITDSKIAASFSSTRMIQCNRTTKSIPYPFPSPADWRDLWIYFVFLDRFNNPLSPPASKWNDIYDFRQGGNLKGVIQQLDYLVNLGVGAIWLSPVLKNSRPDWPWNYHGYATQDFLTIDGRLGSDGTSATAEKELIELVEQAHARGLYVIMDIVLNHSTRAFDYVYHNKVNDSFTDAGILYQVIGGEPPIQWLNGLGNPRSDWQDNLPPVSTLSADDAIWPVDLQEEDFFRRRGSLISDQITNGNFVKGDFGSLRQLVVEYDADAFPSEQRIREKYGKYPVLSILIQIYQYMIAKFDLDGFRIDTVKYVDPDKVEIFGNAIREFALSIGKKNFFTFGEIYDDEKTIASFVGRNSSTAEGYGIDAALDFPLFYVLPGVAKSLIEVETIRKVYSDRKNVQEGLLSSHGEAGRYFISFLDNHDLHERFNHINTPSEQIIIGLAAIFCLQGIPCLYYGTEQGLTGIKDINGNTIKKTEAVREALWGKTPLAFDDSHPLFKQIQQLAVLRKKEPALRYGRQYFRPVSINGHVFGQSFGKGGILAFSRILNNREILFAANTSYSNPFDGFVIVDQDLNRTVSTMNVAFSNLGTKGTGTVQNINQAQFYEPGKPVETANATAIFIKLAPMEVQVLIPV